MRLLLTLMLTVVMIKGDLLNAQPNPAGGTIKAQFVADGNLIVYDGNAGFWYIWPVAGGTLRTIRLGDANWGDQPVVGRWNGRNIGVGVWRSKTGYWYLDSLDGSPMIVKQLGDANWGDQPVVGRWGNDGRDGIGVWRSNNGWWYLQPLDDGSPMITKQLGDTNWGDQPVVGRWGNDGRDGIGVWRSKNGWWYLQGLDDGSPMIAKQLGGAEWGDLPVVDSGDQVSVGVFRRDSRIWYLVENVTTTSRYVERFFDSSESPGIRISSAPDCAGVAPLSGDAIGTGKAVACYIRKGGQYYNKPFWTNPISPINITTHTWSCAVNTGGLDGTAEQLLAYLVPVGYFPPLAYGETSLPPALEQFPRAILARSCQ